MINNGKKKNFDVKIVKKKPKKKKIKREKKMI